MLKQITIIGNVGNVSEIRTTKTGKAVANFSVAVNEQVQGESKTTWFTVTLWNGRTQLLQHIKKGDRIFVQGNLNLDTYFNQQGEKVAQLKVNGETISFLGNGRRQEEESHDYIDEDEIPF